MSVGQNRANPKRFQGASEKCVGANGSQYGDVAALSQEKSSGALKTAVAAARSGHFRLGFFGRLIKFANKRKAPGTPSGSCR